MTEAALNSSGRTVAMATSVVVAGVFADVLTKVAARSFLTVAEPVAVLPGLNLTLGFNPGVAFGLFPANSTPGFVAMVALQSLLVAGLVLLAFRASNVTAQMCFTAVLAGAVGNLANRLVDGAVTDFLDINVRGWHWPAFNLADTLITVGAAGLVISELLSARHSHAMKEPETRP